MIFRKKIPKSKKSDLFSFEKKIIEFIFDHLDETEASKLREQLRFLVLKKRIKYPKSYVIELYPLKFNSIPKDNLLTRTEEFKLASLQIKNNNSDYYCQCHMVLGSLFDISIKPIPKKSELNNDELILKEIKVEDELKNNIN